MAEFLEVLAYSAHLQNIIREKIVLAGGKISFAEFMRLALYAPADAQGRGGYYTGGTEKFGPEGDFITAPIISEFFSYALAEQCATVFNTLSQKNILEFGAGTGIMAADILQHLEKNNNLPAQYYILEISADLQQRQRDILQEKIPHLIARVQWLSTLPEKFSGIILANEVLDAMPVHQIMCTENEVQERYVIWQDKQFKYLESDISSVRLRAAVDTIQTELRHFSAGYQTEINLMLDAWLASLAEILQQGVILLIDYGFPRHEYFHPQRSMGTLMCHYRHRAHSDPFLNVGLQDITAHVDFTAVAEAATKNNLDVLGFTTQAAFLLNNKILELANSEHDQQRWRNVQKIQQLIAPQEMGELFKVMALGKNFYEALPAFEFKDMLGRL
ncbi:MAG: class I SAM-dependent methyltransferase [Gammaproteobacteria bacterium]|nr:class I SAM-dependent methyltransferase [Gammaproteobacteria bacterium]